MKSWFIAYGLLVTTRCHCAFGFVPRHVSISPFKPDRMAMHYGSHSRTQHHNNEMMQSSFRLASSTSSPDSSSDDSALDRILSRLTSCFPLFVLSSAALALIQPSLLTWVKGNLISIMLASVMCGTGLTLQTKDFTNVLSENWRAVPLGVLLQFAIMPLSAWTVGKTLLLPSMSSSTGPALFLGLCLVGSCPGGTASNLVSLIAQADVALSVILTACSTLLAVVMTPLLVKLLVGSHVQVSGVALCQATARVVLLPVLIGMLLKRQTPKLADSISRWTPFGSVLLVSLICGGVVAQNTPLLMTTTTSTSHLLPIVVVSVLLLHLLGFAAGYWIPKISMSEQTARTISIEVGMQNSALAVVLAQSIGAASLAGLPGALSATVHSCLGSMLAAYWRLATTSRNQKEVDDDEANEDDDYSI